MDPTGHSPDMREIATSRTEETPVRIKAKKAKKSGKRNA
jgi:hypothetical protein